MPINEDNFLIRAYYIKNDVNIKLVSKFYLIEKYYNSTVDQLIIVNYKNKTITVRK